jgi:eukaryotic-like serine/threonine-protein kinase
MATSETMLGEVGLPDRYQVLRRIATGGMASVWCAHDRVLGRRVAIKLLAERFAGEDGAVRRFKREARAAARVSGHPHVVATYDVGETPPLDGAPRGRAFIVMEYLAGGNLADALRLGEVERADAVRWIREAAAAIDYAHGHGVLHRDIKLANLLLDCDRSLHVADFGIARVGSEETITSTGQVLGTAAYLAPERALGRPATAASDRYSLAVAAFELLAGERPFTAEHFAAQARQHVDEPPPAASARDRSLPAEIDAVLARGMAKRPEDRWPTATAFAKAVEEALAPTRSIGDAPTFAAPAIVRPRRRRRAIAAGALAVAALAVGITIGASHGGAEHPRVAAASHARSATGPARRAQPKSEPRSKPKPAAHTRSVSGTLAAARTAPPTADALDARGHALMEAGDYGAAIPVLRQALAAAPRDSLTYAYALYDLGRSLRLAGDPKAAVPVLWRRLQIPNQTDVVRNELRLALLAIGATQRNQPGSAPSAPGPAHGPSGHDHHGHGPGGGEGD